MAADRSLRVTLVKTGSVTHSFNMEQRLVELDAVDDGATVAVTVPADEAVVTPGWYLLSVIDGVGVPSESPEFVALTGTSPPAP